MIYKFCRKFLDLFDVGSLLKCVGKNADNKRADDKQTAAEILANI